MEKDIHNIVKLTASHLHTLFTGLDEKTHKVEHKTHQHYIVMPVRFLLDDPVINHIKRQLQRLTGSHFKNHYLPLLEGFAEFVQGLPIRVGALMGSLLKESIAHAFFSTQVAYDVRHETADPRFLFVVFSATLLQNIAVVKTNQLVLCCDEDGQAIRQWNPLTGNLFDTSKYYRQMDYQTPATKYESEFTLLLARQLMPKASFEWISDDDDLFAEWLNILLNKPLDEWETRGKLMHIISFIRFREENHTHFIRKLKGLNIPYKQSEEWNPVFDLLTWLTSEMSDPSFSISNPESWYHLTEAGVFLEYPILFEEYIGRYARAIDAITLVNLCNAMGIIKKGGHDYKYDQFYSSLPKSLLEHLSFLKINGVVKGGVLLPVNLFDIKTKRSLSADEVEGIVPQPKNR